jgi:hypothetical protein
MKLKLLTILVVQTLCMMQLARAKNIDFPCGTAGTIAEKASGPATVTVYLTNNDRNITPVPEWPKTVMLTANDKPPFTAILSAGTLETNPPHLRGYPGVCDAKQITKMMKSTGEVADLDLESIFHDPDTDQFLIQDLFGTIAGNLGFETPVRVPDLFADTNGDGMLGEGDVLYSTVDMSQYIHVLPDFALGDTFTISNGLIAGLPGMMFSTTPFTYDPIVGISGTPANLEGTVEALHEITPVPDIPEPASLLLVGSGALALIGYARCRSM